MTDMTWDEHQRWELDWWGGCLNTFGEEAKQLSYALRMGLVNQPEWETWPRYDLGGRSVLDLGGGPVSMLLKCVHGARRAVVDPGAYPPWVMARYAAAGIEYHQAPAEYWVDPWPNRGFDEVWLYNVLQHTCDPEMIVANARRLARETVRVFEWIDVPPCPGHPQMLSSNELDDWLGDAGTIEKMTGENGCRGHAYYGAFAP